MSNIGLGLEGLLPDEFINQTLLGDPTLLQLLGAAQGLPPGQTSSDVWEETVPGEVKFPYILYSPRAPAIDTETTDGTIVLTRGDYLVKVVDRAEMYSNIQPIWSRIHQLLHRASGMVADGQILFCQRIQTIHYPEIDDQMQYRHLGGVFRFTIQPT